jgi:hypothetical protein
MFGVMLRITMTSAGLLGMSFCDILLAASVLSAPLEL